MAKFGTKDCLLIPRFCPDFLPLPEHFACFVGSILLSTIQNYLAPAFFNRATTSA